MRATLERIEKNQVSLQIEVEADHVEEALEKAYRKVVRKVSIPGFRKGRVPRPILEARLGKQVLYEEALEMLLPQAYQEAVEETAIDPIDQPKIDVVQLEAGQPLIFKATVEVLPEVKLGQYKGVAAVMPEVKVGDDEVELHLKMLQQRHARLVDAGESAVDDGDIAVLNYEATVNGKPEPRLSGQERAVEVGSGKFIPGFEAHLLGAKAGEEKEFTLILPSLFNIADLAGKEVLFKVKIASVKRKELSPLDDEFARDVSECSTLAELKTQIRNKLEEMGHLNAKRIFTQRVVEKVVPQAEVEIPDVLVTRQVEKEYAQFAQGLALQRMDLDQYLRLVNKDLETLKADFEARARDTVKERLVLGAIAKAEGLKVAPEELEEEIKNLSAQYGLEYHELRKNLEEKEQLGAIEDGVLMEKVQKFLSDHALILPDQPEVEPEPGKEADQPKLQDTEAQPAESLANEAAPASEEENKAEQDVQEK
ncbi:MAG: trigger factor [Bacillota bacterium]|nr:trigger factor [Bacillota bacterium]